jgi:secondary thiamine-phosphate synthase enzyme
MAASILHVSRTLTLKADGRGFLPIGARLNAALQAMGARQGLLNVFVAHTSASLCVQENTDPDVLRDLLDTLDRIAPENRAYRHSLEGPDDMPAHIKAMLTSVNLALPVRASALALGTWQEVYLIEHRRAAMTRRLELDFAGHGNEAH